MKKLKSKVFLTIFIILSLSFLTITVIYNYTVYAKEKNNIENNLLKMGNERENNLDKPYEKNTKIDINLEDKTPPEKPDSEENPKRFMDVNIYTIIIKDNSIDQIISHTKDATTPTEIEKEAQKIIDNKNSKSKYIGNLYFNRYSYRYNRNNNIIIIDNLEVNQELKFNLLISIIVFIILEIIAIVISKLISKWIIEPVEVSFNKQKQFIADASHELKTPLSVIIASSEAYENDNKEKWLKNIQNEADRMSKLIKDLLDLAKLEDENVEILFEDNNLSKITEMSLLSFESLLFEKDIQLKYDIDKDINFKCNNVEIKQLIAILMDNAIKHSIKEGLITLNLHKNKDQITLQVINKGNPIPKDEEDKIFERFYRIDKSRNRNENRYGLGLAIAKSIVERHNGTIKAYSKDGFTTFEVIFKK